MSTLTAVETYPAWLEIEIGLDRHAIALSQADRTQLFEQRIKQGLEALERACPGVGSKLEVFPGRPFAFTGTLNAEEIRAIWYLPELRLLADHGQRGADDPQPDEHGLYQFIVSVHQHIQAEASTVIEVEAYTLLVNATDEGDAKSTAVEQCASAMPEHFMASDYVIHRRWWTAEHAHVNSLKEDVRSTFGNAVVLDRRTERKKNGAAWRTDESIERVTYGSPEQRPKTWEWMLS